MRCVGNALHPWGTGEIGFWIDDAFLDETARRVTRLERLEQLCCDMYKGFWHYFAEASGEETMTTQEARAIKARMQELGLLEAVD